jgi:hypothetical protein
MACACGSKKKTSSQKWLVYPADGGKPVTYSSEMDARMAASSQPGSRVTPG